MSTLVAVLILMGLILSVMIVCGCAAITQPAGPQATLGPQGPVGPDGNIGPQKAAGLRGTSGPQETIGLEKPGGLPEPVGQGRRIGPADPVILVAHVLKVVGLASEVD
jgi:hypothetical protein